MEESFVRRGEKQIDKKHEEEKQQPGKQRNSRKAEYDGKVHEWD